MPVAEYPGLTYEEAKELAAQKDIDLWLTKPYRGYEPGVRALLKNATPVEQNGTQKVVCTTMPTHDPDGNDLAVGPDGGRIRSLTTDHSFWSLTRPIANGRGTPGNVDAAAWDSDAPLTAIFKKQAPLDHPLAVAFYDAYVQQHGDYYTDPLYELIAMAGIGDPDGEWSVEEVARLYFHLCKEEEMPVDPLIIQTNREIEAEKEAARQAEAITHAAATKEAAVPAPAGAEASKRGRGRPKKELTVTPLSEAEHEQARTTGLGPVTPPVGPADREGAPTSLAEAKAEAAIRPLGTHIRSLADSPTFTGRHMIAAKLAGAILGVLMETPHDPDDTLDLAMRMVEKALTVR